jgi:unsaturated rhamnogalacturonyl hydrolase
VAAKAGRGLDPIGGAGGFLRVAGLAMQRRGGFGVGAHRALDEAFQLNSPAPNGHHPAMTRMTVLPALTGISLAIFAVASPAFAQSSPPVALVPPSASTSPAAILKTMEHVADWQLANPSTARKPDDWTQAALYTGMMALGGISGDPKYLDAMVRMAETNQWQLGRRVYDADDHCVGQTYAELYLHYGEDRMIAPMRERFDHILSHPTDMQSLEYKPKARSRERWCWCDALFMGPPTWMRLYAATGDTRYMDFAVTNWWQTSDFLYDPQAHLFFRDSTYFEKREANGKKVFWGRGNGWVIAGLVRMLEILPNNRPDHARFVRQFRDLAEALLACQQPDGLWRASLLDPDSYPLKESSSSGFCAYAFAWGLNQGLLDEDHFGGPAQRAWQALVQCVQPDGKLTHVQPVGADPKKFDENSTEPYGVGAFLLAGSEFYRMAVFTHAPAIPVRVRNPSDFRRVNETVSVNWSRLYGPLGGQHAYRPPNQAAVQDGVSARILDSQLLPPDEHHLEQLLFQVTLAPGETRLYRVLLASAFPALPQPVTRTSARLVTERFNDIAWESDRIAHRMYQQALIKGEGTISSGIDVWSKRTRALIIDKWYKHGDYHNDHGEGMDDYRVGRSRGCGGLGIWDGKQLYVSSNFREGRVVATGPIRSEIELTYDGWDAAGRKVSETKRISIDAGSNFSRAQSVFTTEDNSPLAIGVGIAQRPGEGMLVEDREGGWAAYWQPPDGGKGSIGCALILPGGVKEFVTEKGSLPVLTQADLDKPSNEGAPPVANSLAITQAEVGKPFGYYFGAGWSKSGDFPNGQAWEECVRDFAARLKTPLQVEY